MTEPSLAQEAHLNHGALIVLLVIVVVVIAALAFLAIRKRRSVQLRERFGPEYDRVVRREGDVRKAENVLELRQKRREKFQLRPLSPADRSEFARRWNDVQAQFVDNPKGAVTNADNLVSQVMQARGYPMSDFEQSASDISVDYPEVVENYRGAHDIALRHSRGQASTEDLRRAMVHYRTLFQQLLEADQLQRKGA
jgi:hypothetical protein